jgi:hypothetical protein
MSPRGSSISSNSPRQEHGESAFSGVGHKREEESRGSRTRTQDRSPGHGDRFLKASLAACRGAAPAAGTEQWRAFYPQVEKEVKTETRLSVSRMCEVAGFNRAGYYRFLDPEKPAPLDMDLRDEMQKIAFGVAQLRQPADDPGSEGARLGRQSQAGTAADAGRQFTVGDEAEVCSDHGLRAWSEGLPEFGGLDDRHGRQRSSIRSRPRSRRPKPAKYTNLSGSGYAGIRRTSPPACQE